MNPYLAQLEQLAVPLAIAAVIFIFSLISFGVWASRIRHVRAEVVALDARGHGKSATPHETARYSRTRMAKDISEAADAIGAERFDLAGYSMGGMVGVITAGEDNHWYNGFKEADWGGNFGIRKCDATTIPPALSA